MKLICIKANLLVWQAYQSTQGWLRAKARNAVESPTIEELMTIYIVDIEAVDTRYTKQWKEYSPNPNATCYKRRS